MGAELHGPLTFHAKDTDVFGYHLVAFRFNIALSYRLRADFFGLRPRPGREARRWIFFLKAWRRATSLAVQRRAGGFQGRERSCGARILPARIQAWSVTREIPTALAACSVV